MQHICAKCWLTQQDVQRHRENSAECPFVALSPLNSVPKQDSAERRIILDLSWPAGTSVNDGISSSSYLGEDISLTYPTVDSIASLIWSVGTGCLLDKRDLKRAYRQLLWRVIRVKIKKVHPSL